MLNEVHQNLWVADQDLRYLGLSVGTRMTVVRLASGELALISPVEASGGLRRELEQLGSVRHIIAPNLYHYRFAAGFKTHYPQATLWAVPGLQSKRPELPIDATIEGESGTLLEGLEFVFFKGFQVLGASGIDRLNECVFFHAGSRTLILTDTAFHFDESFPLLTRCATRLLGGYRRLEPSLLERIATTDRDAVRAAVERVLDWDFERVIVAHGSIVEQDARGKFLRGYQRFLGLSRSDSLQRSRGVRP